MSHEYQRSLDYFRISFYAAVLAMSRCTVLLTGATGFVGSALLRRMLELDRFFVIAPTRSPLTATQALSNFPIASLDGATSWEDAFRVPIEIVVHCAARAHIMVESAAEPLAEFRRVNVEGTLHLARQAAAAGVKRFVFISSIKVNGEATAPQQPFTADQVPRPSDPYGVSKWEAEVQLNALAKESGMEIAIIRPVLVYGPGVKANFLHMMRWLEKGVPLPFGAINNRRSLVSIFNLVDLVVRCTDHPGAANQTFLVSDGEDISTSELLARLGRFMGTKARLLPVPSWVLYGTAALLGRKVIGRRLCGSLQVDIDKTCRLLDWSPIISMDASLKLTAEAFLESRR